MFRARAAAEEAGAERLCFDCLSVDVGRIDVVAAKVI